MRPLLFLSLAILPAAASAQNVSASLDSAMRVAERNGFAGVVRVQRGDDVLLERGYGLANRDAKIAYSPATVVQIGSNTKDFTAVALLQLQEKGRLSFGDSLGRYFPDAPAEKRNITIAQLMSHRAGFPLGLGGDFEPVGRQALIDGAMRAPLLFTPGARESYSNTGFSLLAAIIERVAGQSYDEYVRDAILAPLGLRRTGFLLPGFRDTELSHGYAPGGRDEGTMLAKPHAEDGPYWNLRGNGGMLSTVGDMHEFYRALFETDRLMTPATRALRFDPSQPIGLAGSDGTHFFLYERFPGRRLELIIASSNAGAKAPMIRRELGKLLGLPARDGPGEEVAARPGGRPASPSMAAVLREFIGAVNSGSAPVLRAFIAGHFANDAGSPSLDARVARFLEMHERLGALKIERMEVYDTGPTELAVSSAGDHATIKIGVDAAPPHLIHGIQVLLGGG